MNVAHRVLILVFSMVTLFGEPAWSGPPEFTDQSGKRTVVEKPFKRIISLYAAHTENLFSLGLDREIIGVSPGEVFPPQTRSKAVFSYHDGVEKYMAAQPDLVLVRPMISSGYPGFITALERRGITVVSLQPRNIQEVFAYWRKLGILTGRQDRASDMINTFNTELTRIGKVVAAIPETARKRVYFEAIHNRMRTFSPASIAMFALSSAGGINVAPDADARHGTNIADYGKERILSRAKEIDVFLAQKGAMNHPTLRQIREEPGFKVIKAVQEGKILIVDEKIVSRPTLRLLDGIHEIGRFLYPDIFNDVAGLTRLPVLPRAQFAQMLCKMVNLPLKTPDYRADLLKRDASRHRYGDFKDVDYTGEAYKFVETAVSRGVFPNISKYEFFPDRPVGRATLAYALFVSFDFPEVEAKVPITDVDSSHPFFEQIRTAAGLGLMPLSRDKKFRPEDTVSGTEAFKIISKARTLAR